MHSKSPSLTLWRKWSPDGLTLISSALIVASFPPWNAWPLIWICLVPWFMALDRAKDRSRALAQGVWLSYLMSIGGFYWVAFVLKEFGNLPWPVSIAGLQAFSIIGQPQFLCYAFAVHTIRTKELSFKNKINQMFFLALFYVCLDIFLPKLFLDTLGHAFYLAKHMRQLADLGSPHLLTLLVFFVNYTLYQIARTQPWKTIRKGTFHLPPALRPLTGLVGIICLVSWTYGFFRYQQIQDLTQTKRGFQAAAIQANIGDFDKIAAERGVSGAAQKVVSTYVQLSSDALKLTPKPQVLIWPETAYPSTFRTPHTLTEMRLDRIVEGFVSQMNVPILFGGYHHDTELGKDYNAFFFLSSNGNLQIYKKNILLLFGEFIPGADLFPWIKSAFPQVGNFGRGSGAEVLTVPFSESTDPNHPQTATEPFKTGPIICYEALFPYYTIESARRGSQFIMNITNDSWFGEWGEPQLHLALTTFRSIETRLPMLRATNTGISTLILADGEITQPTGVGSQEILNVFVPITDPIPTLMKLWGDWFKYFVLVAFLGMSGLLWQRQSKNA